SYGSFDRSHPYLDNCGNSRANTCKRALTGPLHGGLRMRAFIRSKNPSGGFGPRSALVTLDNLGPIARPRRRRRVFRMSALSTFDGPFGAYHGDHGKELLRRWWSPCIISLFRMASIKSVCQATECKFTYTLG